MRADFFSRFASTLASKADGKRRRPPLGARGATNRNARRVSYINVYIRSVHSQSGIITLIVLFRDFVEAPNAAHVTLRPESRRAFIRCAASAGCVTRDLAGVSNAADACRRRGR